MLPDNPIVFDPAAFVARYPEFAGLTTAQLNAYFAETGLYCVNATWNPAYGAGVLGLMLNMLTAHIAWLYAPRATPEAVSARLEKACEKIYGSESFQKMEAELGALPRLLLGKDYAKRLNEDAVDKAALIKTLNITQE